MKQRISFLSVALVAVLLVAGWSPPANDTSATQTNVEPGTYALDMTHSEILFKVRHLGISNVRGNFNEAEGTLTFANENVNSLSIDVTIQAASIDTDNERRDNHLRSADFFEVETYPTLTFKSTEVTNVNGDNMTIVGDLTMHGVTKQVELDTEFTGAVNAGRMGNRVGFEATTTIDRKEFGLTWNNTLETGGLVVGDEVTITLAVSAVKQ